jgi:hypothetical protein
LQLVAGIFEMKYYRARRYFSEYSFIRDGLSLRSPSQALALTLGENASFGRQSQIVIEPWRCGCA